MIRLTCNMIAWVFFPKSFLFGDNLSRNLRVPTFETLCFVDDPLEIKAVHKATGTVFLGGAGNEFLTPLLGVQSAFTTDGNQHKLARKIAGRWLTARAMNECRPEIDAIITEELENWMQSGKRDIGAWSRWVTMRILCKIALGVDDPKKVKRLYKRFEAATGYLANIVSYTKRFWTPRGLVSVGHIVAFLVRRIDREMVPLIEAARAHIEQNPAGNVLQGLVGEQVEHGYDDGFVRDNLMAIMAAGYDTTGSALTWSLFWLAIHPDKSEDAAAFRAEVLRYCPPVEILPRRIAKSAFAEACSLSPSVLSNIGLSGVDGPLVCPCVHRVHHNSDSYSEPQCFDPTRFAGGKTGSPDTYMPFGAGGRMCLGINLGKLIVDRAITMVGASGLTVTTNKSRFSPIRRNVSIWPGFMFYGRLSKRADKG